MSGLSRAKPALPALLAFVLAFGVYYAAYKEIGLHPTGDEPHYVLEALSLSHDGDRDLSDDYNDPSELAVLGVGGFGAHAFRYTSSPRLVSIHNVGLPALLTPAARTKKLTAIRIELILIAALGATALLGVLRALRILRGPLLYAVWAAVAFSLPLVGYSSQIYPELPAATFLLVALWIALSGPVTPRRATIACAVAALAPWLHVRYVFLAAPLTAGIAVAAARRASRLAEGEPRAAAVRAGLLALAPLAVSLLAMSLAFWAWYGSPLLNAQYRPPADQGLVHHEAWWLYQYGAGSLLGSEFGWLPIAPVHLLGIAALGLLCWRFRWWGAAAALTWGVYLVVIATSPPGYSFASRYLVPVIPLVAVPLALAVAHVRAARFAFVPLALLTWAFALDGVRHAMALYAPGNDILRIPLAVKLHQLWPALPSTLPGARYPAAALVAGWVLAIAFVGWLFLDARDDRRRARGFAS